MRTTSFCKAAVSAVFLCCAWVSAHAQVPSSSKDIAVDESAPVQDLGVSEVESYIHDRFLIAPCDGEVMEIYPKRSELLGTGSPVMSIVDMNDVWFTFSVREDLLQDLKVGSVMEVQIPALGEQTYKAKVTYLRAMASYATWRATKTNGQYDVKSFDVKLVPQEKIPDMRPGMTVIIKR